MTRPRSRLGRLLSRRSPVERLIADRGQDPQAADLAWLVRTGDLLSSLAEPPGRITLVLGAYAQFAAAVLADLVPTAQVHVLPVRAPSTLIDLPPNVELTVCESVADRVTAVAIRSRPDVIVERGNHQKGQKHFTFRHLFPLVADGGRYVVEALETIGMAKYDDHDCVDILTLLGELDRIRALPSTLDPETGEYPGPDDGLASVVAGTDVDEHRAIVVKSGTDLLKLRDEHADDLMTQAGVDHAIWVRYPTQSRASRVRLTEHGGSHMAAKGVIEARERTVREYRNVHVRSRQRVFDDRFWMPDTFRHPRQRRLTHRELRNVDATMARPRTEAVGPVRRLEGSWFLFDTEYPGHYGHILTEVLSRVPGWRDAVARCPDLRPLVSLDPGQGELPGFQRDLFAAVGIDLDTIGYVGPDEEVVVESLVAVTPDFAMPTAIAPRLADLWDEVGRTLHRPDAGLPRRFFVTRPPSGYRMCHDTADVERFFADEGYAIVRPEELSFADQVTLFRDAEVIAGFAGSGMFTAMFAREPRQVLLSGSSYTANNEYLIGSVVGGSIDVFWGRSDVEHPHGGWTWDAFYSPFTFDVAEHADALRRVLGD